MPILQQKLVIKSIEALHDEALSLVPDTAENRGITQPPAVLRTATPPQKSPIDTPSSAASDQDIMGRIDHLLKNLMKMMISLSRQQQIMGRNQTRGI